VGIGAMVCVRILHRAYFLYLEASQSRLRFDLIYIVQEIHADDKEMRPSTMRIKNAEADLSGLHGSSSYFPKSIRRKEKTKG
jgi:hypothetical protein